MPRTVWAECMAVAAGSALGGVLRHLVTEAVTRMAGPAFPWGTAVVNVAGSLVIGACTALIGGAAPGPWSPGTRSFVVAGVLGGFTTFSAFSVQTLSLLQQGLGSAALANVVLSVTGGVAACWLGFALATAALTR